jgi:hypothetical protein
MILKLRRDKMLIKDMNIPNHIDLNNFSEVSRDKLVDFLDSDEVASKNKWRRNIESKEIHSFRVNTVNDNKIIGLMIFQNNAPKSECVKCFMVKP